MGSWMRPFRRPTSTGWWPRGTLRSGDSKYCFNYLYRTVTDAAGNLVESHAFDPFGMPRNSRWESQLGLLHSGEYASEATNRGFTGHEHLDFHRLIHMGGRAYDPALGRFLSVDPVIGNVANAQTLNPYTYVLNNPLAGMDPSGYEDRYTITREDLQTTAASELGPAGTWQALANGWQRSEASAPAASSGHRMAAQRPRWWGSRPRDRPRLRSRSEPARPSSVWYQPPDPG